MDPRQVQDGINLADEVIARHHFVEVKLIEQVPLARATLTHHHPLLLPTALANRNHTSPLPSTDFCNTIGH